MVWKYLFDGTLGVSSSVGLRLHHSSTFENKWILSASELVPRSFPVQCCGIFHYDFREKIIILTFVHIYLRCGKYKYHINLSHSYSYDASVLPTSNSIKFLKIENIYFKFY